MEQDLLIECGFTKNQARVYIALLRNPGSSAGKIASNLSMDRSFIYDITGSLIKRGLAYSSVVKNKKIFFAESPKQIVERLESQKAKAEIAVKKLENIKRDEVKKSIEIYEGKQALKKYISQIIENENFFAIGGGGRLNMLEILKYEYPHYFEKLKKEKITGRIICSNENKEFWENSLKGSKIEIRSLVGAGKENSITLLGDKIILSEETDLPSIVIINNPDQAHSIKHYLNLLWKIAKK